MRPDRSPIRLLLVDDHAMVHRGMHDFIRAAASGEVHLDPAVAGIVARHHGLGRS